MAFSLAIETPGNYDGFAIKQNDARWRVGSCRIRGKWRGPHSTAGLAGS
ncbi:hypothetical protein QQ054_04475 [Oscillatoria amoena NRMC-F 0135]|nr:hypothetical protein [Oscillatoria amoena NRMC-F 0135]